MIEKLTMVTLGGNKLPIRCDINILATLQEEYGTISKFQQLLIGIRPVINRDGSLKYDKEGKVQFEHTEPSIKVIAFSLPYMIKEGILKAQEQQEDIDYSAIEWHEAYNDFDFDYIATALAINEEFERCFNRKKKTMQKSTSNRRSRKPKQSTSQE